MAGVQSVWGIDMGRCALKALKLRPGADDKVEIVASDYIEHAKILSQPDADRHALIAAALEKFLSRNDISKDQVVISVPGQHTLARFTKLPPVAPKRIPDIVRYEADQQIPFDMDEVIWDYQTFQQEGLPDVEVGIFAMKRELIREHLLHFEQASIEPIAVQSGPLAVYNAGHFDGLLSKETTVLVDIGAENTDLIVATPSSFWTRTVPIGGNAFTEALVKSFKLSFSKAEGLKRTAATSKYARQIFQAMRPIFADLVQELQRSIGFYSSTHRDANVDKVVAFGNAMLLPGLQKYLQQNLGLPVEKLDGFRKAAGASKDSAVKEQFLSFAVAYGLALQGMDLTKITSNLLPTEIAKQVAWRKKRPAFAAAAACLFLAGGVVWLRQNADASALAAGTAGAEAVSVRDEEQAITILNSGPPPGLADRARAKTVVDAANTLKRTLSTLAGKGTTERTQTEELIELQANKVIVPSLLRTIHESVPREHDPVALAGGDPAAAAERVASLPPRGERNLVTIESLDVIYEPDLRLFRWESMVNVPPPINNHDPNVGDPLPGLLVKMNCTTPNSGGASYIRDSFMEALRTNGREPGRGFYIDHIILLTGGRWEPESAFSSGPGMGAGRTGGAGGRQDAGFLNMDVVTNESREGDWRFEVWADVILEDLPPDALPGETGGEDAEAGDEAP